MAFGSGFYGVDHLHSARLQRACTRARNSFCISATAVEAMRLARAL